MSHVITSSTCVHQLCYNTAPVLSVGLADCITSRSPDLRASRLQQGQPTTPWTRSVDRIQGSARKVMLSNMHPDGACQIAGQI